MKEALKTIEEIQKIMKGKSNCQIEFLIESKEEIIQIYAQQNDNDNSILYEPDNIIDYWFCSIWFGNVEAIFTQKLSFK